MFNLNDTGHEAGIILYGDNTVGVYNWGQFDDGFIPMVGPVGMVVPFPVNSDDEAELVELAHVDDVREYLPGSVWETDGSLETDMDVAYDEIGDIHALWGYGETAKNYKDVERPYSGSIWEVPGGYKVITIDFWN